MVKKIMVITDGNDKSQEAVDATMVKVRKALDKVGMGNLLDGKKRMVVRGNDEPIGNLYSGSSRTHDDDDCCGSEDVEPNIYEDERDELGYRICVELPGVAKDSVNVKVVDGELVISAEREDGRKYKEEYPLDEDDNQETVSAKMSEGLLKVSVNKKEKFTKEVSIA